MCFPCQLTRRASPCRKRRTTLTSSLLVTRNILRDIKIWRAGGSFCFFYEACQTKIPQHVMHIELGCQGNILNSYWGLGSKHVCLLFNFDDVVHDVLQYVTRNVVGSLCISAVMAGKLELEGPWANALPLRLEFPVLPANMPFCGSVCEEVRKLLIPNGCRKFVTSSKPTRGFVWWWIKLPLFISMCTLAGI